MLDYLIHLNGTDIVRKYKNRAFGNLSKKEVATKKKVFNLFSILLLPTNKTNETVKKIEKEKLSYFRYKVMDKFKAKFRIRITTSDFTINVIVVSRAVKE